MNRIAAIQMTSGPEVASNLAEATRLIGQAVDAGATMVVLPENFAIMPMKEGDRLAVVEKDGAGPIQDFLCEQARQHRIWLIGGTIPLQARQSNKVRAACLLFDDQGTRVARYDKIHLFRITSYNVCYTKLLRHIGISQKIEDEAARERLRELLKAATEDGAQGGYILRTMAETARA